MTSLASGTIKLPALISRQYDGGSLSMVMTFDDKWFVYAAEGHGEKKVNFWEAPTNVSTWKEEQVNRSLSSDIFLLYRSVPWQRVYRLLPVCCVMLGG